MPELGQKRKCLDGAILPDMKFRRMRGKVPKKQQRALALVPLPSKSGIKDEPQVDLKATTTWHIYGLFATSATKASTGEAVLEAFPEGGLLLDVKIASL